jgi:Protein of unknown function (DUF2829)
MAKFEDALAQLRQGATISRKGWKDRDYLFLSEAGQILRATVDHRNLVWEPKQVDVLADDWLATPKPIETPRADVETMKGNPKYESALLTMRALLPAVYVRTDNPAAIPKLVNDIFKGRWGFFHSTDPTTPSYETPRARHGHAFHAGERRPLHEGYTPLDVITALAACDPGDEQGFAVIQIEEHGVASNTIPSIATKLDEIVKRRFSDPRWIGCVWFVGTLPPHQVVPEDMRDDLYPVDLLVGTRHKGEGTYDYVRKAGLTDPEEIQKLLFEEAHDRLTAIMISARLKPTKSL